MSEAAGESVLVDNIEVCRLLGVKSDCWRNRVATGTAPLPFTRMGVRSYYRRVDINHFLKRGTWPARTRFKGRPAEPESEGESDPD